MKIKKCPFCGTTKNIDVQLRTVRISETRYSNGFYVRCLGCDTRFGYDPTFGGAYKTEAEAIEAWNRRTR